MSAGWIAFWPYYLNLVGLGLDMVGFVLVAREFLKRPLPADEMLFWKEDMPPVVRMLNLSGFWLVIGGFLAQFVAQVAFLEGALVPSP